MLRIPANAKVDDAFSHDGWILAHPRSEVAVSLHTYLTTVPLPTLSYNEDSFEWVVNEVDCSGFSSALTWEALRPREVEKDWADAIWFKGAVPRNAFNMWVAHLDRLPTRQRLAAWGVAPSSLCCLCSTMTETRDHLLVSCAFASVIWRLVFSRLVPTID